MADLPSGFSLFTDEGAFELRVRWWRTWGFMGWLTLAICGLPYLGLSLEVLNRFGAVVQGAGGLGDAIGLTVCWGIFSVFFLGWLVSHTTVKASLATGRIEVVDRSGPFLDGFSCTLEGVQAVSLEDSMKHGKHWYHLGLTPAEGEPVTVLSTKVHWAAEAFRQLLEENLGGIR